ncbi:BnaC04g37260D [Brassica napus]|uniref:(rape) hypothetical protein n=1 Tax=Brassica napus TaxID=3708 RepID=A0A078HH42_BRANA|nr:unnamed protein product [Brassica napus]CDY36168.1 BnaC04g37260D [Brassica napus]
MCVERKNVIFRRKLGLGSNSSGGSRNFTASRLQRYRKRIKIRLEQSSSCREIRMEQLGLPERFVSYRVQTHWKEKNQQQLQFAMDRGIKVALSDASTSNWLRSGLNRSSKK